MTVGTATSNALAAWDELNDRQRGTLAAIFALDQAREEDRKRARAQGIWDKTPAAQWRQIDFAHEPANRDLYGWTLLQETLAQRGWDSQGNGATMAALTARRLIARAARPTLFGEMHTVALTKAGRAAVRAGTDLSLSRVKKPALSERSWEVLGILWSADAVGRQLDWGSSATIDRILIGKREQPLAQRVRGGYALTDAGRRYYRDHYSAHIAAYPEVVAPHPDGPRAEPWPGRVDAILARHHNRYTALATAWRTVHTEHEAAVAESLTATPTPPAGVPTDIEEQFAARHQLRCETAALRAGLAAEHLSDLTKRCEQAAHIYAAAATRVFTAVTTASDPLAELPDPALSDEADDVDIGHRVAPPPTTGIFAIDEAAGKLHATATGTPRRRRGPAPEKTGPPTLKAPGAGLADLAAFLHRHTYGGALLRRLHPTATITTPAPNTEQDTR